MLLVTHLGLKETHGYIYLYCLLLIEFFSNLGLKETRRYLTTHVFGLKQIHCFITHVTHVFGLK